MTAWGSRAVSPRRKPGVLGSRVMGSFFDVCFMLQVLAYKSTSAAPRAAESPKTDPVTMRVRAPRRGKRRRTLYGQGAQSRANRPQAAPGGGDAGCRSC